jgi:hypothetical protein
MQPLATRSQAHVQLVLRLLITFISAWIMIHEFGITIDTYVTQFTSESPAPKRMFTRWNRRHLHVLLAAVGVRPREPPPIDRTERTAEQSPSSNNRALQYVHGV